MAVNTLDSIAIAPRSIQWRAIACLIADIKGDRLRYAVCSYYFGMDYEYLEEITALFK